MENDVKTKICTKCGIEKPLSEFRFDKFYQRYRSQCKECEKNYSKFNQIAIKEKRKRYYLKNKEKFLKKSKFYREKNKDKIKAYRDSHKDKIKQLHKEWLQKNKAILKEKRKIKYEKNKIIILKKAKLYREKNKDTILKKAKKHRDSHKEYQTNYNKNYYLKNRIQCLKRNKQYILNRLHVDLNFKIKNNLRTRMYLVIKKKHGKTLELLGCSIEFFKKHLEVQFKEGMSWDNYGRFGWHVDHIRPCASFDLTDPKQQQECFHYTNLQPLWWRENIKKGAKYGK